jgi:hypothetical protein
MNRTLIIILILLLTSCYREEVLEIDSSNNGEKLVVYSVISPQTDSIFVSLAQTNGDLSQLFDIKASLPPGEVVISSGEHHVQLKQLSIKPAVYGCSQKEFQIEKGKEYTLTVKVEGYLQVRATTKVPDEFCRWEKVKPPTYGIKYWPGGSGFAEYSYFFEAEWKPLKNVLEKNYWAYRTGGIKFKLEATPNDSLGYRGFHYRVIDSLNFQNKVADVYKPEDTGMISSNSGNLKYSTSIDEDVAIEYGIPSGFSVQTKCQPSGEVYRNLTFYLFTFDEHYSSYWELVKQYDEASGSFNYPFSSFNGTLPSYTNIEGGFGIFGSYGLDSVYFEVYNKVNFFETVQKLPKYEL